MDALLILLAFLFVIVLIIGVPILLIVYPYKRLRKTRFKKYAFLVPVFIVGFIAYLIYSSIYPSEDFYKDDFEYITKIDFPASGRFLFKNATYPDIHGHYTSLVLLSLSSTEYKSLLDKVNNDQTFKTDTVIGESSAFKEVLEEIKGNQVKKIMRKNKMVIGFVNDNRRVILERRMSDNYSYNLKLVLFFKQKISAKTKAAMKQAISSLLLFLL